MGKAKAEAQSAGPAVAAAVSSAGPVSAVRPRPARQIAHGVSAMRGLADGGAPGGGTLHRAQHAGTMQRTLGNARINELLGPGPAGAPARGGVIQRKCACGGEAGPGGECAACKAKREGLIQRHGLARAPVALPSSVQRAFAGSGQSLGLPTRTLMEDRFGADFSAVRVHTGDGAAHAARDLRAEAFTTGQDIYFGAGRYQPDTQAGQRLLAHELTHTVQQRRLGGTVMRMAVSAPDDAAEQEAEAIAQQVAAGERIERRVSARPTEIQRYSWDDFVDDASAVGDAVSGGVGTAANAVSDAASAAVGAVQAGASTAVDAAGNAVSTAVSWLETSAGQLALAGAQQLAASFGGAVTITGTAIVITIPDVELCTPRSIPFTLPMMNVLIPFWGWAGVFGPIGVGAAAGVRLGLQPSVAFSYGPCRLQHMALRLDPLRGSYSGTAQLYVAGAVTDTLVGEGALKVIGVVGLFSPPIAIMAGVEGGLRATLRGVGAGALQETVTVAYTGGAFSLDLDNTAKLGGSIEFALDFFANASLYDFVVCEYVLPLVDTTLYSDAEQWSFPVRVTAGGVTTGPLTRKPIPFSDIEVFVNRQRPETRCLSLSDIRDELCKRGYLPDFLCPDTDGQDEEPGALKDVTALGRCKCVGDDDCGGGRIYEVCYRTQKDCKNAQKDLDNFCNNNEEMKRRCTRPKCYYRHSKPNCPKDCTPGVNPLAEAEAEADDCPPQAVKMSGAQCGRKYGAVGEYCYKGAKNWFFKEKVTNGSPNTCDKSPIDQTTSPIQSATGCVDDQIFNFNGPPSKIAPCTDVTNQIVFAGPTRADVEKCQYKNKQVIDVSVDQGSSPATGRVTTSSAGVSTSCKWK